MKKALLTILALAATNLMAYELEDIAGVYDISSENAPVINVVKIEANGSVYLIENGPYGALECEGSATLVNDMLTSEVTCDNGASFTQRVNLSGVSDLSEFSAPVYSSLYGMEVVMNVMRLEKL